MRIGIDARWILNPEKNPAIGVGHYTYQLIRHLLQIDHQNQYILFFDYRVREKDTRKFQKPNVKIKYFPWSDYKKYLPGAYSEILGLSTLTGNNLDILHTTSPDARIPLGYYGKVVCTFQDLAVHKFPKLFPEFKKVKAKYNRQAMAKRADRIIAVSETTKKDIQKMFKQEEGKITVVKNGIDERFFEENSQEKNSWEMFKEKFKINEKYVLFIGTLEPIKNITRLLQAFKIFKSAIDKEGKNSVTSRYQLVLGGKRGWLGGEYLQIAKDLKLENDVRFLGYVEGDNLKDLFKNCEFFIMPSLYEGFGTTVLEAMACRVPCLVSDTPALKEVAGDKVSYFNPIDIFNISEKMKNIIKTKNNALIEGAYQRAKEFSWNKCAEETLRVYEKLAQK